MRSLKSLIKSSESVRAILAPAVRTLKFLRGVNGDRRWEALSEMFEIVEGGSLVLRLPAFNGSFELDSRSHILRRILTTGEYEPELVKVIREKLDVKRDAIDVGANAGLFTVLLASLNSSAGRVLAVEPTPGAVSFLRRNIARNNKSENVIVFEGAASHSRGEVQLRVISGKEEYSSATNLVHPAIRKELHTQSLINVASDTIDHLTERFSLSPGFIKIDTEGSEYDVLLGCEKTMYLHRPVVMCESWDDRTLTDAGGVPGAVANLLKSRGYVIHRHLRQEILAVPAEERSVYSGSLDTLLQVRKG